MCTTPLEPDYNVFKVALSDAHDDFDGHLVQLLISVAAFCQSIEIEASSFEPVNGFLAVAIAEQSAIGLIAAVDLLEECLDLWIGVKVFGFDFEHVIGAHAAQREVPHALFILCTVGMGIEMARTGVAAILQQLDQEEQILDVLAAETE